MSELEDLDDAFSLPLTLDRKIHSAKSIRAGRKYFAPRIDSGVFKRSRRPKPPITLPKLKCLEDESCS
jgi:hypothetical protein